jgi:hypothetical protein
MVMMTMTVQRFDVEVMRHAFNVPKRLQGASVITDAFGGCQTVGARGRRATEQASASASRAVQRRGA